MKKVILFVYLIIILSEIVASSFAIDIDVIEVHNVGDPLILTPLIKDNKIKEARNKAIVNLGGIESYSGYLTVNKQFESNLFFWFIPTTYKFLSTKLTLWIQGEPGRSSLFGLFIENGPFLINSSNKCNMRKMDWNYNRNILYIDSPVGTGFSFTNGGYSENATQVAKELYNALLQFYKLFPECKQNKLEIVGQFLAGKYLPELANIIREGNTFNTMFKNETKLTEDKEIINLNYLIMGNALSDPINQIKYGEYLYHLGLINSTEMEIFKEKESEFRRKINKMQYHEAYTIFQEMMTAPSSMFKKYTQLDNYRYYNYNYQQDDIRLLDSRIKNFVTSAEVRSAIHVGNMSFQCDDKVEYYIKNDIMKSVANLVSDLSKYYFIIYYSGQSDIIINYPGTIEFIEGLKYSKFKESKRVFMPNIGAYKLTIENLRADLVMRAGHMTGLDNPPYMNVILK